MNCYMGIDIGTSGCKAVAFDETGKQLAIAYREYDVITPQDNWAELDSDDVIAKCFEVISEVADNVPAGAIAGMGISSQGEAFTAIDAGGKTLCNALISSDTRAAEYAQSWPEQFGVDRLYEITGHTAHPLFTLFKLLWLKDNRPEVWAKADKFLCFEDLLQYRLGLDPAMGWPLAGRTMLFDVRSHQWSQEILDCVGLSADNFARPAQSGQIVGKLPETMASQLGLGGQPFVVAAGHDQACGALGAGAVKPGLAMYATGTVECITPAFGEAVLSEDLRKHNLATYDHTAAGMYITVAYSLTGGNILKWFRDEFGAAEVAEAEARGVNAYQLLLEQMPDEPAKAMVLPYFTPTGTPFFDTEATGAILGLRLSSRRGEIIKALLEGVAFEMRLNLDILDRCGCKIDQLRAIGGGARSEVWTQLKADVIGKPIVVLNVEEAGCMGVAMLARAADSGQSLVELAESWVQPVQTKQPRPELTDWYNERFDLYSKLYPALKQLRF